MRQSKITVVGAVVGNWRILQDVLPIQGWGGMSLQKRQGWQSHKVGDGGMVPMALSQRYRRMILRIDRCARSGGLTVCRSFILLPRHSLGWQIYHTKTCWHLHSMGYGTMLYSRNTQKYGVLAGEVPPKVQRFQPSSSF